MGKNQNSKKESIKGIKIQQFDICMIIISVITFIVLIYNTFGMPGKYHQLISQTEAYIACEKDGVMLGEASDYLTEQVRLYVENMDVKYMYAYFTEVNETKRREQALASLKKHNDNKVADADLEAALQCSNDLMDREIYAMKLISEANDYKADILPEEVQIMPLKAEDAALGKEEKIEKARTMVFDNGYQDAKALIKNHLDHFLKNILSTMKENQQDSENVLGKLLSNQRVLISFLFILNIVTYFVITVLIVRPLSIHIKKIKDNEILEIIGSYEFKYLALTYNDIYELHATNEAMLSHEAEHDPLTGILNRRGFDELKLVLKSRTVPLILILIDVDNFKIINDGYGHEMGDRILKKVADLLTGSFRSTDYIIRLGGDEFAVITTGIQRKKIEIVERKFQRINEVLQNLDDDLPPVSLSAGAACSECGYVEELYNQADQALYYVKEHGRCGFHVE